MRAENLPDIEAHQFKVVPVEKSHTGRVYRFRVEPEELPHVGSILLIEENRNPTMAFRVLKTDTTKNEFVAKRVRRYDATRELVLNERYDTVEKISDLVTPPPPEREAYDPNASPILDPNPGKDLINPSATPSQAPPTLDPFGDGTQIPAAPSQPTSPGESAQNKTGAPLDVEKYDNDLDSSTSPTNLKTDETVVDPGHVNANEDTTLVNSGDDDSDIDPSLLEVKERKVLNPYRFSLGFMVGSLKNLSNFKTAGPSGGAFSIYFSHVVGRNVLIKNKGVQDSLSFEYGGSYYNQTDVNGHNDDYTFFPVKAELRYDVHLSETFSAFLYGGFQYNWIASTINVDIGNSAIDAASYDSLRGFQANLGIGVFYNIGPQWYLRGELGFDRLGVGLAVKW